MGKVDIKLNHSENRRLLRADPPYGGVLADLKRRADAAAEAAGPGMEAGTYVGPNRARSTVITATPEAMVAEARHRALTRAIDHAR